MKSVVILMQNDELVYVAGYLAFGVADFDAVDINASSDAVVVIVLAIPFDAGRAITFGVHFGVDGLDELAGDGINLNQDIQFVAWTIVLKEKGGMGSERIGVIEDVSQLKSGGCFDDKIERGRGRIVIDIPCLEEDGMLAWSEVCHWIKDGAALVIVQGRLVITVEHVNLGIAVVQLHGNVVANAIANGVDAAGIGENGIDNRVGIGGSAIDKIGIINV